MTPLRLEETGLPGVQRLWHGQFADERGEFMRLFCAEGLKALGLAMASQQINWSRTREIGAVRGLHFQYPPAAEIKIITCLKGEVFDVAVDIRRDSARRLAWFGERLHPRCGYSLVLREGLAHGFQALAADSELLYLHSVAYSAEHQGGLHPLDPSIAVAWPLPVTQLSERDAGRAFIDPRFEGVIL